jgi:2-polyprenyl-3-methyl-5-hydroxy-6-metoxy-1,4-benzoquinol methylase
MWSRRLRDIEKMITGGDILDVGCGDGLFLELAKGSGWRVQGTDVSAYATEFASKRLGQNVFCGEIWDAGFHAQSFDAVTLWHVLEHTTQPARVLHEVRRVLRAGGTLVLAVPNLNDHLMRLAYRLVKGRRLRRFSLRDKEIHLFHFSVNSIRRLLDATGFECRQIGPDFGILELSHRLINITATAFFYMLGVHWYNSIQVIARRE